MAYCFLSLSHLKSKRDLFIIPPSVFDEDKPFIVIDIPCCKNNENKSKDFVNPSHHFTNVKILYIRHSRYTKMLYFY